ncbi:unnamed protein product [Nezara viridula]|uniref:Uncharacterized protein n=1 Tax=Nezara viridula TaxID=85310 RepID=A0A9P0HDC9_NEZVI|nr:unnamed protein product [Nezara viridula]
MRGAPDLSRPVHPRPGSLGNCKYSQGRYHWPVFPTCRRSDFQLCRQVNESPLQRAVDSVSVLVISCQQLPAYSSPHWTGTVPNTGEARHHRNPAFGRNRGRPEGVLYVTRVLLKRSLRRGSDEEGAMILLAVCPSSPNFFLLRLMVYQCLI